MKQAPPHGPEPVVDTSSITVDVARLNRMVDVVQSSPVMVYVSRYPTGPTVTMSENVSQWGYTSDDFVSGRVSLVDVVHPEDMARELERLKAHAGSGDDAFMMAYRARTSSGEYRFVNDWVQLLRDADGVVTHQQGVVLDVTDQERTAIELRRRETLLQQWQQIAGAGSWEFYPDTDELVFSKAMCDILGLDEADGPFPREMTSAMIYAPDRERALRGIARVIAERKPYQIVYRIQRPDGEVRELLLRGDFTTDPDTGREVMLAVAMDVTRQRRLEREILDSVQAEQRRIGHELHDTLGQELVGIRFIAQALATRLRANGSPCDADASRLADMIGHALKHVRSMSRGLAPVDLDQEGLVFELTALARRTADLYGIQCDSRVEGAGEIRDPNVATHLYYIAREAVTNAVLHGGPGAVSIALTGGADGHLEISDDGTWAVRDTERADDDDGGLGLHIMRYRAELIGGDLAVSHEEGEGTTVSCSFSDP